LLKFRKLAALKQSEFLTQGRPASTLRDGDFRKGRRKRKQETGTSFFLVLLALRSLPAISEKRRSEGWKYRQLTLRNPYV